MQGKNVVIIGGSHGIGAGVTQRMVARGANVFTFSRTAGELVATGQVQHMPFDVTTDELTSDHLPETIDALAYCPGSITLSPIRTTNIQQMRDDFELNVLGAVRVMQAAQGGLKKSGAASVVLFSTVAVQFGFAMHTSVAAAKGAVEALARTWAAELAPKVRVNCVAPALTNTPLAAKMLTNEQRQKALAAMYPLKRYGEVDDIAAACEYLLSPTSAWVTGQVFHIDGGISRMYAATN